MKKKLPWQTEEKWKQKNITTKIDHEHSIKQIFFSICQVNATGFCTKPIPAFEKMSSSSFTCCDDAMNVWQPSWLLTKISQNIFSQYIFLRPRTGWNGSHSTEMSVSKMDWGSFSTVPQTLSRFKTYSEVSELYWISLVSGGRVR